MADLLECLIQVKALAETPRRIERLLEESEPARWREPAEPGRPSAAELIAELAEIEAIAAGHVRLVLTREAPALEWPDEARLLEHVRALAWTAGKAMERLATRRAQNLEVLNGCTASDFNRVAREGSRTLTLADLVADMLARDVDAVGAIRSALGI